MTAEWTEQRFAELDIDDRYEGPREPQPELPAQQAGSVVVVDGTMTTTLGDRDDSYYYYGQQNLNQLANQQNNLSNLYGQGGAGGGPFGQGIYGWVNAAPNSAGSGSYTANRAYMNAFTQAAMQPSTANYPSRDVRIEQDMMMDEWIVVMREDNRTRTKRFVNREQAFKAYYEWKLGV